MHDSKQTMCIYITLKGIDGQSRTKHVYYFIISNGIFGLKKSVPMIYFLVIKQLNMSENLKIGFYVYAKKKYTCVIKRYEYAVSLL